MFYKDNKIIITNICYKEMKGNINQTDPAVKKSKKIYLKITTDRVYCVTYSFTYYTCIFYIHKNFLK